MSKQQYGTWTRGHVPDIGQMINICLDGMKHGGYSIPKNQFGALVFTVGYRYSPPLGPDDLRYLPDGLDDTGFTAIKITYEVDDEGQAEPCGEEHEPVQQAPDTQEQEEG